MTEKEKIKFWAKGRLFEIMNGIGENDAKKILTDLISFINPMQKEPVSEDLEEAAIQFATDTETGKVDVVKQSSFFWGAIYQKQQMMAKAINTEASFTMSVPSICISLPRGVNVGDKVKVIVIKED